MCGSSRLPWSALLTKTPAQLFQDPSTVRYHMCHPHGVCCGADQGLCSCLQWVSSSHHWNLLLQSLHSFDKQQICTSVLQQ